MSVNRRRFLAMSAGAGALPLLSAADARAADEDATMETLERAAAEPVLDTAAFTSPVVIESIRLLKRDGDFLVHVRSKDGAQGISVTNGRAYLHPILEHLVVPYFIGKDARELERHLFEVYRFHDNYKLQGLALWCPVAWVEFAVLDMLGRIAGKPLGQLLGGVVRREVPFYVASGRRDTSPEQEVEYLRQLVDQTGARAVKFRVGGRMSRNADASPGRTETLIPLARKSLGDDIALHADANSSYDPPKAIEVGRMLEEVRAVYFEEPCPFDHLGDTKKVADALEIPVAGGEQEFSEYRFCWTIAHRGVDIVQPDLHYYGGLIRSRRVAKMAAAAGMPTTVHISGGFGFVYMLHFASCTPDIGRYQEYKLEIEKYRDWFDPLLESKGGSLGVPGGPGVGIAKIEEFLEGARAVG
ncbi:MAG: mandelate racemase/muconate lactonizing enzyme family protein [Pirellulales bacterium]|nr:mandelate racemase/muconate lactonizing enzyme family protein [Pirellulales bacterium]